MPGFVIFDLQLFGLSRPWDSEQNRAAMRQLPATQTPMAANGCLD